MARLSLEVVEMSGGTTREVRGRSPNEAEG